ncbi:MAG: SIR2 family NAD-dependent protein deacylase [Anaerolineae bacterium]
MEDEIHRAATLLAGAKHAVALTGAGISTPSGIPDFRSPTSGLWSRANPMLMGSIWGFRLRPQAFYDWVRPLVIAFLEAKPNPAHLALARLEEMGILKAVITQNIDNLHQKAGSGRILELHGHLREATCLRCHKVVPAGGLIEKFLADGLIPRCECGGVMKPNIVFFGELLPFDVLAEAQEEARRCDLMLVAGSSLEVAPASEIPFIAWRHGAHLIIVNYQPTPLDGRADFVFHEDVAQVLPRLVEAVSQMKDESSPPIDLSSS